MARVPIWLNSVHRAIGWRQNRNTTSIFGKFLSPHYQYPRLSWTWRKLLERLASSTAGNGAQYPHRSFWRPADEFDKVLRTIFIPAGQSGLSRTASIVTRLRPIHSPRSSTSIGASNEQ